MTVRAEVSEREDEIQRDDGEIECVQVDRGWRRGKGEGGSEKREGEEGSRTGEREGRRGNPLLPSPFSLLCVRR
jgi:hypothetical protein